MSGVNSELHIAAFNGDLKRIRKLLEDEKTKALINSGDQFDSKPLHRACEKANEKVRIVNLNADLL